MVIFSSPIFWRCVPDAVPDVAGKTAETFFESSGASGYFEEIMADVSASWKEIIYMCLVAFGLSIVVTILFRFLAGLIVWIIIAVIALASIVGPCVCWYIWYVKKSDYDAKTSNSTEIQNTTAIEDAVNNEAKKYLSDDLATAETKKEVTNWLIIAISVTVVAVSMKIFF